MDSAFVGPAYNHDILAIDCQRSVNWMLEQHPSGQAGGHAIASLIPTPGLRSVVALPYSPIRGVYTTNTGKTYAAAYNKVYEITLSAGVFSATAVTGTLSNTSGPVSFADNGSAVTAGGNQMCVCDGQSAFLISLDGLNTFTAITDAYYLGAQSVIFIDGFFIFHNAKQLFMSAAYNGATGNIANVWAAEGAPDPIQRIMALHRELWIFGTRTTEVHYNTGTGNPPFQRIPGALIEIGTPAPRSVARLGTTLYWLGQKEEGQGVIYRSQGYGAERVSTHAIEWMLQDLGDLSGATATTYEEDGHALYILNLEAAQTTIVFDATTHTWHERRSYNNSDYTRWRGQYHTFNFNRHLVTDYLSASIYEMSGDILDDNGAPIVRERTSPHMVQGTKLLRHKLFKLEMSAGLQRIPPSAAYATLTLVQALPTTAYTAIFAVGATPINYTATYTSGGGSPTLDQIVTGLVAAINALACGVTATAGGAGTGIVYVNPTTATTVWFLYSTSSNVAGVSEVRQTQVMLSWSDDWAHTWSNEQTQPIGASGNYKTRIIFRRLGASRGRVYRLRIADPVRVGINGAQVETEDMGRY